MGREGCLLEPRGHEGRSGRLHLRWTDGRSDCYPVLRTALFVQGQNLISTQPGEVFDWAYRQRAAMAGNLDWKKAQCERLEEERNTELGLRSTWWSVQRAKWEDEEKKGEGKRWASGSWSWSRWDWFKKKAGGRPEHGAAKHRRQSRQLSLPPVQPRWLYKTKLIPPENREEDLTALRAAAITPVSFAPHRHVMMALGRPVVVLFESLNVVGGMV